MLSSSCFTFGQKFQSLLLVEELEGQIFNCLSFLTQPMPTPLLIIREKNEYDVELAFGGWQRLKVVSLFCDNSTCLLFTWRVCFKATFL